MRVANTQNECWLTLKMRTHIYSSIGIDRYSS
nr:MAG TPA: hypothetical protein [Caudoviricetes sp.]